MAKARLRRGIEIIKLANRIEALKMQEDEEGEAPGDSDVPANPKIAAKDALSGEHAGEHLEGRPKPEKRSLSKIAKGAIFREVVLAKVKEIKAQEEHAKMEADAKEKAKRNSIGQ
jgi:calcium/calmodulin-dependent protein kinase I